MPRPPKITKVKKNCIYCKEKTVPLYRDLAGLKKYLTERGKIIGRGRTGVCSKHQKDLAQAIKRARFLGFLSYVNG